MGHRIDESIGILPVDRLNRLQSALYANNGSIHTTTHNVTIVDDLILILKPPTLPHWCQTHNTFKTFQTLHGEYASDLYNQYINIYKIFDNIFRLIYWFQKEIFYIITLTELLLIRGKLAYEIFCSEYGGAVKSGAGKFSTQRRWKMDRLAAVWLGLAFETFMVERGTAPTLQCNLVHHDSTPILKTFG